MRTSVIQHGDARTLFGSRKKRLTPFLKGKINKDGKIVGTISPADSDLYKINVRLTRLGDLN